MNKTIGIIVAIIVVGGGMFYAGIKYNQSTLLASVGNRSGQFAGRGMRAGSAGVGFATGEILSLDSTSVTLKLQDGGSRIIFVSTSTPIMKTTDGAWSDLVTGKQISITGTTNSDGSITAKTIQIRPAQPVTK